MVERRCASTQAGEDRGAGRATPAMRLSLWITYVAVVSGFAITGIQYVLTVWSR